jgi:hypothetical protein
MQHPQKLSPQQVLSNTDVQPNPKHWKPFGCPTYVLDPPLQSNTGIFHKWKQHLRVGIYIGRSPQHARSVALVLDRQTGLVSPQFHVKFNPSFQTVEGDEYFSIATQNRFRRDITFSEEGTTTCGTKPSINSKTEYWME